MTKKIFKIVSILVVLLLFSFSYVLATDINLNLPGVDTNIDTSANNTGLDQNMIDDQTQVGNNLTNQNTIDDTDVDDVVDDLYNDSEVLAPSTMNSSSQAGLTTSDIINILLITVGVILILLAIAIMIRLKNT